MSGFCPRCGSILPLPSNRPTINCYCCNDPHKIDVYGDMKVEYSIYFNQIDTPKELREKSMSKRIKKEADLEGPVVERKCPACSNEKMSYATLQLRSADEGQTVFYTCTKCKFKETENS
ncbi:RNA polymerase I subunit RpI12 [Arctopsyche grandis]|uniref:RNA polymerase I subunit RpI12 n=1 Tax=Arctopsyche grandis TaxID=121162 RepID=UPI00406D6E72